MSVLSGNGSSATRLVEAIAGSSGSIIDPASATGSLPILGQLGSVEGDTNAPSDGVAGSSLGLLDGVSSLSGDNTDTNAASSNLALAGQGTPVQPIFDAVNSGVKEFHVEIETLSHQTGTSDIVHSITNLGETIGLGEIGIAPAPVGPTNLITDVLNLPASLLSGNLDGIISDVGHDLTDVIGSVMRVKDGIIFGNDPINPVPELIQGIGNDLSSLPILTVGDGQQGGVLDVLAGDLSHSSSNHLADVNVGPEQEGGLPINLLAAIEPGPSHTAEVNAVDVGPNGPHLLAIDAVSGGSDSLVGNLLNLGSPDASQSGTGGLPPLPSLGQTGDMAGLDLGSVLNSDHGVLNLHGVHVI